MWKQVGPWDLLADVESGKIKMKQDLPIVRQELEPGYLYVGQTPTLTGVFVGRVQCHRGFEEGEFIHESSLRSGICLNGYGRAYRSEKFYEGQLVNGEPHGFGRGVHKSGQVQEG